MFQVEDVFSIKGKGTVVTGRVLRGHIRIGDKAVVHLSTGEKIYSQIVGIEAFRRILNEVKEGDNVGLLLQSVDRNKVERGCYITDSTDPTNIHNNQHYYDKDVNNQYCGIDTHRETMIDGKPISREAQEEPKTFFQRLFGK